MRHSPARPSLSAGWASSGECTANPGYMLVSCAKSCAEVEAAANQEIASSFYDLQALDADGRWIDFGSYFRDRVVLITNVASE